MSSIGAPKRTEAAPELASSKNASEALAQRQIDAGAGRPAEAAATELHIIGFVAPEGRTTDDRLETPRTTAEHAGSGAEAHASRGAQGGGNLAHQLEHALHAFEHAPAGMPPMPMGEAADAKALGQAAAPQASAARQRSLQQGQQGFVIPLLLRAPRRSAYTEKPEQDGLQDWDVEAIEALIGLLHVSVGGGMQTHDDPAMRKERRLRRWLVMLAQRRRARLRQARPRKR